LIIRWLSIKKTSHKGTKGEFREPRKNKKERVSRRDAENAERLKKAVIYARPPVVRAVLRKIGEEDFKEDISVGG
jgi:hypothetical protein